MITSKQRAYLRSMANGLDTIIQIGKSGVTPELTDAVDRAIEARELIKLNVLDNTMLSARQASEIIAERAHCEVVQVIGNRFVLYRKAKKPTIVLPK